MKNILKKCLTEKKDRVMKGCRLLAVLVTMAVLLGLPASNPLHKTGLSMKGTDKSLIGLQECNDEDSSYAYGFGADEENRLKGTGTERKGLNSSKPDSCFSTGSVNLKYMENSAADIADASKTNPHTLLLTAKSEAQKNVKVMAVWPEGAEGIPASLTVTANDKEASAFALNSENGWTEQKTLICPDGESAVKLTVPEVPGYSHVIKTGLEGSLNTCTIHFYHFQKEDEYPVAEPEPFYPDLLRYHTIDSFRDGVINPDTALSQRTDIDLYDYYRLYSGVCGPKPMNVLFVIDQSGSMADNSRLADLKKAVTGQDDSSGAKSIFDMIM